MVKIHMFVAYESLAHWSEYFLATLVWLLDLCGNCVCSPAQVEGDDPFPFKSHLFKMYEGIR